MQTHAPYLMLDQRFFQKFRLVYGVRAEHYNLDNRQEEYAKKRYGSDYIYYMTVGERNWRLLPSANLSYSLTPQMRSEEHTSELQSRENLVCRLLLEKK